MSTGPADREDRRQKPAQARVTTVVTTYVSAGDLSAALPCFDGFEIFGADAV